MKVVIAIDSFKECMNSMEAGDGFNSSGFSKIIPAASAISITAVLPSPRIPYLALLFVRAGRLRIRNMRHGLKDIQGIFC